MTTTDLTMALRDAVQALMNDNARRVAAEPSKYWYPLSVVSYDAAEIMGALDSMCSFRTTMGEKTDLFERRFAERFQHPEAVMVNSGSSADLLIAFALVNPETRLLQPGDEVLVPSVTWPTQIWSLLMAGLRVRMVDTDPGTLNIRLDDLEAKITARTRGISIVHLMGNPCDMDAVMRIARKHNLVVFEDCCESLGAKYRGQTVGSFGVAAAYSFFFSHHITTMEGGMIGSSTPELSDLFRLLRAHGWSRHARHRRIETDDVVDSRYRFVNWGFNVRPTEVQAAFGLEQLERVVAFNDARRRNADRFAAYLERHHGLMRLMKVAPEAECSWFALPIVLTEECPFPKTALTAYLEESGIESRPVVAGNLARQPVCKLYPANPAPRSTGSARRSTPSSAPTPDQRCASSSRPRSTTKVVVTGALHTKQ
jgi:CDP-4-dehydro-6-deoxyglucose reductase, E1